MLTSKIFGMEAKKQESKSQNFLGGKKVLWPANAESQVSSVEMSLQPTLAW